MHETKVDLSSTWLITVWYCGQENELATCYNMKPRKNKIHEHHKPIIATSMVISSLCRCLWSKRADLLNGPAIENYIELGMNVKHCCILLFSLIWRCRAVQRFILQLTFQWPGQGEGGDLPLPRHWQIVVWDDGERNSKGEVLSGPGFWEIESMGMNGNWKDMCLLDWEEFVKTGYNNVHGAWSILKRY